MARRTTPAHALWPEIAGSEATCMTSLEWCGLTVVQRSHWEPPQAFLPSTVCASGPLSHAPVKPRKREHILIFANLKSEKWNLITILIHVSFIMTNGRCLFTCRLATCCVAAFFRRWGGYMRSWERRRRRWSRSSPIKCPFIALAHILNFFLFCIITFMTLL